MTEELELAKTEELELAKGLFSSFATSTAGVLSPTAGVLSAVGAHLLTNARIDATWREGALEIWQEIIIEGEQDRRRFREEVEDEFSRFRYVLDWIQAELESLGERVGTLEVAALGIMADAEGMLRQHSDPEMRPYLLAAWSNMVRQRDKFTATWVRRLLPLFTRLGPDHLRLLVRLVDTPENKDPDGSKLVSKDELQHVLIDFGNVRIDNLLVTELVEAKLLVHEMGRGDVRMRTLAIYLGEFVRPAAKP